jgi:hypothetical protein
MRKLYQNKRGDCVKRRKTKENSRMKNQLLTDAISEYLFKNRTLERQTEVSSLWHANCIFIEVFKGV